MFSDETKKLMQRDQAEYSRKQNEIREKIAEALEGCTDSMAYGALHGALIYGWKRPNGYWHPAPKHNSSKVIEGRPPNE